MLGVLEEAVAAKVELRQETLGSTAKKAAAVTVAKAAEAAAAMAVRKVAARSAGRMCRERC